MSERKRKNMYPPARVSSQVHERLKDRSERTGVKMYALALRAVQEVTLEALLDPEWRPPADYSKSLGINMATRERLDALTERTGLKKYVVIDRAVRAFLDSREENADG